ncbi:unnamed protein product, partial [Ectocarpus sp. 12 AP-2014]
WVKGVSVRGSYFGSHSRHGQIYRLCYSVNAPGWACTLRAQHMRGFMPNRSSYGHRCTHHGCIPWIFQHSHQHSSFNRAELFGSARGCARAESGQQQGEDVDSMRAASDKMNTGTCRVYNCYGT